MKSLRNWEENRMVEWKTLKELCSDIIVPMRDRPKVFDGHIPWCRIEDIEGMYFNKSLSGLKVSEDVIKEMNLKVFPIGTVICSCSATLGVCAINTQPLITNQTFIGLVCGNEIINRFLFYYMLTRTKEIKTLSTTGTIPYVSRVKFEKLRIPIPSLSEQNRIVGILDTFTDSIENLKQQIAQRRKQYEFYRDQLLDLEGKEGVEMKTLGESSILISDGDHQPPPKSQQGIPFITISNINKDNHKIDFSNTYYVPSDYYESLKNERKAIEGDVLYTVTGSYGIPVIIDFTDKFCFQRHIAMIRPNIKVLISKFLYHCLLTRGLKKQADEYASGGAQKTVSLSSLRKFVIPVPSLSEQQRIVSILDTFEASISNLEAQLAQRQKQYEYYRNKLLTFE